MKHRKIVRELLLFACFLILVLLAAGISLKSRPVAGFAILWLPNALVLGLWVRFPQLVSRYALLGAACGYLGADVWFQTRSVVTFIFACGNLASIGTAYMLLMRLSAAERRLVGITSVLKIFAVTLVASAVGGAASAFASYFYLGITPFAGWSYWFVTDAVNYVTILPALLALPRSFRPFQRRFRQMARDFRRRKYRRLLPLLSLVAVGSAGLMIGGPGAITFPLPVLLWCAVTYDVFTVACLTLLFGVWAQWAVATDILMPRPQQSTRAYLTLSLHLGIAFIAVCPNILVAVISSHRALLVKYQALASRDSLSGLLNRRSFFGRGQLLRAASIEKGAPISLLMIDIDNFKSINDGHGHLAGDEAIRCIARTIEARTRSDDVIARIGGEEFAILSSGLNHAELDEHAERIRKASEDLEIVVDGARFSVTVSIGAIYNPDRSIDIDRMIRRADEALYRAKQTGRNRVVVLAL